MKTAINACQPEIDMIDFLETLNEGSEQIDSVIKAGETSATLTITPKNNLTANREIRLSINPVSGYALGDKKIAIIPVEVKEHIMYTFKPVIYRLLSEIDIRIEVEGENSGSSFNNRHRVADRNRPVQYSHIERRF